MTKNVHLRLLIVAMMLLTTAFLTYTSPVQAIDPACCDACNAEANLCFGSGQPVKVCRSQYWACIRACNAGQVPEICP